MITELKINKNIYLIILLVYLTLSYSIYFILNERTADLITSEDGLVEWISALSWLISSIIIIYLYFKSKSFNKIFTYQTKRNIFYLLLGILFFIAFGEEISWGQRVIGFQTPDYIVRENAQREFNIHNLKLFTVNDCSITKRLFFLFWFTYCLIIPILYKYNRKVFGFLSEINLPIIPLWIGILFLINFLLNSILYNSRLVTITNMNEIRETNAGILFLTITLYFLRQGKRKKSAIINQIG